MYSQTSVIQAWMKPPLVQILVVVANINVNYKYSQASVIQAWVKPPLVQILVVEQIAPPLWYMLENITKP